MTEFGSFGPQGEKLDFARFETGTSKLIFTPFPSPPPNLFFCVVCVSLSLARGLCIACVRARVRVRACARLCALFFLDFWRGCIWPPF
jgi:hypothetical protein